MHSRIHWIFFIKSNIRLSISAISFLSPSANCFWLSGTNVFPLFTWSLVHYMGLEQVTDCPLYSSSWFSPTIKQRIYTAFLWQTSSIWSRAGLMLGHYTLLGTCWYMADWLWIIGPHFWFQDLPLSARYLCDILIPDLSFLCLWNKSHACRVMVLRFWFCVFY